MTAPLRRPPGRYDTGYGRAQRVAVVVLAAVFGVALLLGTYRLYERFGNTGVGYQLRGYEVLSDTSVRIDVTVAKDRDATALCRFAARGRDGREVGTADVTVPPGRAETRVRHEIPTSERAVTAVVRRCALAP